jgi:hypothetical protein
MEITMSAPLENFTKALRDAGLEAIAQKVRFPWGFKIVDEGGQKILQGLTPKEYKGFVESHTNRKVSDAELLDPRCFGTSPGCASIGCPGVCIAVFESNTLVCECR